MAGMSKPTVRSPSASNSSAPPPGGALELESADRRQSVASSICTKLSAETCPPLAMRGGQTQASSRAGCSRSVVGHVRRRRAQAHERGISAEGKRTATRLHCPCVLCLAGVCLERRGGVCGERESGVVVSCLRPGTKKNELLLSFSEKLGQHLDISALLSSMRALHQCCCESPTASKIVQKSLNNHNFTSAKKEDKSRLNLVDDWRDHCLFDGNGEDAVHPFALSSTRLSWAEWSCLGHREFGLRPQGALSHTLEDAAGTRRSSAPPRARHLAAQLTSGEAPD